MKKIALTVAGLLLSGCLVVACSAGRSIGTTGSTENAHAALGMHIGPSGPESGIHSNSNAITAMLPGPLRFMASFIQAQPELSGSTSVSMSLTGYCPYTGNADPGDERLIYGLGELVDPYCINSSYDLAPAQQYMGSPIVGSGTLSTLVVYSSTASASDTGLIVKVYDNNKPTPLTCTIKTGENKCEDLIDTTAVNDGDYITTTYTYDAAQAAAGGMSNVRVMLGKQ